MKKLILIDAHALIHRVYHALPRLTSPRGELVNAVYGFSSILIKIFKELKPDYILAAFDLPTPTFRHQEYKEYKATRVKAPDELYAQIPHIRKVLEAFGVPIYEKAGFEADDIIGTIATRMGKDNPEIKNVIASGDLDTLQLVDKNTEVFGLKKGITETTTYDEKGVFQKYGLKPSQVVDFKGLKGDPSDNIPGVKGVGEKTASSLLAKFGTLENLYKEIEEGKADIAEKLKEKLLSGKEEAFFSKYLATIKRDVPLDFSLTDCEKKPINKEKVSDIFKDLGFFSLIKRLDESSQAKIENAEREQKNNLLETKIINVSSEADLKKLKDDADKNKQLIVYLDEQNKNMELSGDNERAYVISISDFGKKYLEIIESTITDKEIKKIGFDLKTIFKFFLKNFGIWMENLYFDVMIADYLLNPDQGNYEIENVFLRNLPRQYLGGELKAKTNLILRTKEIVGAKMKELKLSDIFQNIEMPLIYIIAQMELAGIKVDENYFKKLDHEFEQKLLRIEGKIYDFAGVKFNVNSPAQLAEVIFEKLKISPKGIKKTQKSKRISTRASELLKLRGKHEIIDLILEYRELMKLKTTYINSLLELVNKSNSRIFSTFSQVGTGTGRLASSEPNLQNLPTKTEEGQKIRRGFIAEKNYLLISFDYSQIELRVAASLADDKKMISAFKEGKDIHRLTAAQVFNVDEKDVTDKMRNFAKVLNFGILYGMGSRRLAQSASMTQEEASKFIDEYFSDFEGIANFVDKTIKEARRTGFVKNMLGRIRYLPEIMSNNFQLQKAAERAAVNMPIQSLAADIIKLSMIEIFQFLDKEFNIKEELIKLFGKDKEFKAHNLESVLVLQIHDELVFEVSKDLVDKFIPKIKEIMEGVIKLKVPLVVDYSKGENLANLE